MQAARIIFIFFLAALLSSVFFNATAMNSVNFRIDTDVIGSAGNASNSTNYNLGDTLGEPIIGPSNSINYQGKFGFWQAGQEESQLGLSCEASDVYMLDYTLGDPNNYSKYIFSTSQECVVIDNSDAPWSLTIRSTDMTSARNNLTSGNIYLNTDGTVSGGDTITSPTTDITESAGPEYSLDSARTIINGGSSASGTYYNRPTIKLKNLNSLYAEQIVGTVTVSLL
jgi:hypothetical protein